MALSKCSKTVTQLRQAYPTLETNLKGGGDLMTEFLKRSSERLDNAWRRCKKLTGTLVTLKRLASVQEQRFHPGGSGSSTTASDISLSPTPTANSLTSSEGGSKSSAIGGKDNTLDDLLDALQGLFLPTVWLIFRRVK